MSDDRSLSSSSSRARSPRLRSSPIVFQSPAIQTAQIEEELKVPSPEIYEKHIGTNKKSQCETQKIAFTAWIDHYCPGLIRNDLVDEMRDGIKLIGLLAQLSGDERLHVYYRKITSRRLPHRGSIESPQSVTYYPTTRAKRLANVTHALDFLRKSHINLVNVNPMDIVDGRPTVVLGLIWTIILHYQSEKDTSMKLGPWSECSSLMASCEDFFASAADVCATGSEEVPELLITDPYGHEIQATDNSTRSALTCRQRIVCNCQCHSQKCCECQGQFSLPQIMSKDSCHKHVNSSVQSLINKQLCNEHNHSYELQSISDVNDDDRDDIDEDEVCYGCHHEHCHSGMHEHGMVSPSYDFESVEMDYRDFGLKYSTPMNVYDKEKDFANNTNHVMHVASEQKAKCNDRPHFGDITNVKSQHKQKKLLNYYNCEDISANKYKDKMEDVSDKENFDNISKSCKSNRSERSTLYCENSESFRESCGFDKSDIVQSLENLESLENLPEPIKSIGSNTFEKSEVSEKNHKKVHKSKKSTKSTKNEKLSKSEKIGKFGQSLINFLKSDKSTNQGQSTRKSDNSEAVDKSFEKLKNRDNSSRTIKSEEFNSLNESGISSEFINDIENSYKSYPTDIFSTQDKSMRFVENRENTRDKFESENFSSTRRWSESESCENSSDFNRSHDLISSPDQNKLRRAEKIGQILETQEFAEFADNQSFENNEKSYDPPKSIEHELDSSENLENPGTSFQDTNELVELDCWPKSTCDLHHSGQHKVEEKFDQAVKNCQKLSEYPEQLDTSCNFNRSGDLVRFVECFEIPKNFESDESINSSPSTSSQISTFSSNNQSGTRLENKGEQVTNLIVQDKNEHNDKETAIVNDNNESKALVPYRAFNVALLRSFDKIPKSLSDLNSFLSSPSLLSRRLNFLIPQITKQRSKDNNNSNNMIIKSDYNLTNGVDNKNLDDLNQWPVTQSIWRKFVRAFKASSSFNLILLIFIAGLVILPSLQKESCCELSPGYLNPIVHHASERKPV